MSLPPHQANADNDGVLNLGSQRHRSCKLGLEVVGDGSTRKSDGPILTQAPEDYVTTASTFII